MYPTAEFGAEASHRRSPAVVEDERAVRMAHLRARPARLAQQVDVFVVCRDEDVDGQRRLERATGVPGGSRSGIKEEEREEAVNLGKVHRQREDERIWIEREEPAVHQIDRVDGNRRNGDDLTIRAAGRWIDMNERGVCVERLTRDLRAACCHSATSLPSSCDPPGGRRPCCTWQVWCQCRVVRRWSVMGMGLARFARICQTRAAICQ